MGMYSTGAEPRQKPIQRLVAVMSEYPDGIYPAMPNAAHRAAKRLSPSGVKRAQILGIEDQIDML